MSRSLVIVESPSKAKTINRYLGSEYEVMASVGHIRDLPQAGSSEREKAKRMTPAELKKLSPEEKARLREEREHGNLVRRMGIDPDNGWKADYRILPGKDKVVRELKAAAAKSDAVYLATDLDREGEAIAWHLREVLGGDPSRYRRVVFNEITQSAINRAFAEPGELDMNKVNAQQSRRFLDRVVGYMVSPLLWKKVGRGLSAGRVQSVAVELIVEREREIGAFVPEEYWEITANGNAGEGSVPLKLAMKDGKTVKLGSRAEAESAAKELGELPFTVSSFVKTENKLHTLPPFTTSTLQQTASARLGFSVKKTMSVAQKLYEHGYITYMRTDSVNLSKEAVAAVRDLIKSDYGEKYCPEKPRYYASGENAQEAHEAIRPSHVDVRPADFAKRAMDRDDVRLYELIWDRFVACQMSDGLVDVTKVKVQAGAYELRGQGKVIRFDGFSKVFRPVMMKNEYITIPELHEGDTLTASDIDPSQHFTNPPARYTEGTLVKELEKRGIGRPSTYASIISTIQNRGYVKVENRRFFAEKMGEIVTDRLSESFSKLMSYDFTAEMETSLDKIAEGQLDWKKSLDDFYGEFTGFLRKAELPPEEGGMKTNPSVPVESIRCEKCGRPMAIRTAATGVFLGCSGYNDPDPKNRCRMTIDLVPVESSAASKDENYETDVLREKKRCPKCGTAMDAYYIDSKTKIYICGNNPDCDGTVIEHGEFKVPGGARDFTIPCDRCGKPMVMLKGPFGPFMKCEACGNIRKFLKSGEVAPPHEDPVDLPELKCSKSDAHFVLRDGAAGIFLAASTFPKSRETRPPKVSELRRFRDRISEKFYYLADAPEKDPEGNETVVRFRRKDKSQYVASEKDGKATGWIAEYLDGAWTPRIDETLKKAASRTVRKGSARKASASAKKASAAAGKRAAAKKSEKSEKAEKAEKAEKPEKTEE